METRLEAYRLWLGVRLRLLRDLLEEPQDSHAVWTNT